jgi:ABC-type branched-subunit amino acid transport system substrate-binding protein
MAILIGMVNVLTGPLADAGIQIDNGAKTALKQCENVAGRRVLIIRRDTGGIAPDLARRLAHDLVARDKVDVLAGFLLTPNALAAAEVSAQAKKLMVVMHAQGASVMAKSPYVIRTSLAGHYSPGLDTPANRAFVKEFQAMHGRLPDAYAVGGYDGMLAVCEALRRTGGKTDADSLLGAAKGLRWESPRGPVFIQPEERELKSN